MAGLLLRCGSIVLEVTTRIIKDSCWCLGGSGGGNVGIIMGWMYGDCIGTE